MVDIQDMLMLKIDTQVSGIMIFVESFYLVCRVMVATFVIFDNGCHHNG